MGIYSDSYMELLKNNNTLRIPTPSNLVLSNQRVDTSKFCKPIISPIAFRRIKDVWFGGMRPVERLYIKNMMYNLVLCECRDIDICKFIHTGISKPVWIRVDRLYL